jgi:hypothetical protein
MPPAVPLDRRISQIHSAMKRIVGPKLTSSVCHHEERGGEQVVQQQE